MVTINDDVEEKLVWIMLNHGCESLSEAIEYAADETLVREDEITVQELNALIVEHAVETGHDVDTALIHPNITPPASPELN